jgi:probable F420-dependent oxidoreductase
MSIPRIGLLIPNYGSHGVDCLLRMPKSAQEWGYDSVWVSDHVVGTRAEAAKYGLTWADPLAALAHLAAATTSVRIGVSVLVVPYRPAVQTAKALATIDRLSGGRLVVGVGAGYSEREFTALGLGGSFVDRGRLTDDMLATMRRCWRGGGVPEPDGSGEAFYFAPAPSRGAELPIWVGGSSRAALRRAAAVGAAWHPSMLPPKELAATGERLDALAGRAVPRTVRLRLDADLSGTADLLHEYGAAGCTDAVVDFGSRSLDEAIGTAEDFATRVLPQADQSEPATTRQDTT